MQYLGLTLDTFQRQAIEAIDQGRSVLVAAPTGTGKTLIADYLVDQVMRQDGHIVYTAPIKALSNQKYRDYVKLHGEEKVGLVTGDIVIRQDAPLRVMTTEILRNILLQGSGSGASSQQHRLEGLKAVIFDELHFLDDPERGTVWEEVLIYLPGHVQILGLSATMPNIDELAGWLDHIRPVTGPIEVIQEKKRAVPLAFRLVSRDTGIADVPKYQELYDRWRKAGKGAQAKEPKPAPKDDGRGRRGRRRQDEDQTSFLEMLQMLDDVDLPALFFVFSRKTTERYARDLVRARRYGYLNDEERRRMRQALDTFDREQPELLDRGQRHMYMQGIAFHHAGVHVQLKSLVEQLYEKRLIKMLFCTSTFALGINMPSRTVLFESLEKFNGTEVAPLTVRQFMQKAGRAGRRGLDTEGQVILRMDLEKWGESREYLQKLMGGQGEAVNSSFNLSFHSVVNLLERHTEDEIKELLGKSFLAFQRARRHDVLREELALRQTRLGMGKKVGATGKDAKIEQEIAKLERKLVREHRWLWDQFEAKVHFLREIHYLDKDNKPGMGAKILRTVQIEEVFVAELVLSGLFEDLTPEEVYALSVGLVEQLPPRVQVDAPLPPGLAAQQRKMKAILEGEILEAALALGGGEPVCDTRMMSLGYLWATGWALPDMTRMIRSEVDVSGDLVGALRRAKDLTGQLREVLSDDPARQTELKLILHKISRDEVEAL